MTLFPMNSLSSWIASALPGRAIVANRMSAHKAPSAANPHARGFVKAVRDPEPYDHTDTRASACIKGRLRIRHTATLPHTMRSTSFAAAALALAATASAQYVPNPQNQTFPDKWDKCVSAGIGELRRNATRDPDGAGKRLKLNIGCAGPEKPCVLAVCGSGPEVKDLLEDYVRAECKPQDVPALIENIETNCWQFADFSAIAAAHRAVAPAAALGVAAALALAMSML